MISTGCAFYIKVEPQAQQGLGKLRLKALSNGGPLQGGSIEVLSPTVAQLWLLEYVRHLLPALLKIMLAGRQTMQRHKPLV